MRYRDVEWELAACQFLEGRLWFPDKETGGQMPEIVKRICDGCDIKEDCLQYALDNGEVGVWGGVHFREQGKGYREQGLGTGEVHLGDSGDLVPEVRSGTPPEMPTGER